MQYDSIILELLSRVKQLENEVAMLKQQNLSNNIIPEAPRTTDTRSSYIKMTNEIISICYEYGKKAHEQPGTNLWDCAEDISKKTGMNRNSAFMYVCAVTSMLSGTVYKRAINMTATRTYFDKIFEDFGVQGLSNAIKSTRLHIDYRKTLNHPVEHIELACNEYSRKI